MAAETESGKEMAGCPGDCRQSELSKSRRSLLQLLGWGALFTTILAFMAGNHTDAKFMSERSDQKLFDVINLDGVEVAKSTLMPPWGAAIGDVKIDSLILHLRGLCKCEAKISW